MEKKPIVGISACNLGQPVRYDGGHKRSAFVDGQLREWVEFRPICPEVGAGLSTPRPTIRLRQTEIGIRLVDDKNGVDHTEAMQSFSERVLPSLDNLSGYIVCAKSPSCGMERVKVFNADATGAERNGRGLFTDALMKRYPLLPVEEDGRLNDARLRENFVTRVLIYQEFQQLQADPTQGRLLNFHRKHKMLLLSHHQNLYRQLGRLVASSGQSSLDERLNEYGKMMMAALARPASRRGHTNVLQHLQGYFKRDITTGERQQLHQTILDYRQGKVPLMAPLSVLRHLLVRFPKPYVQSQSYLQPHPEALALRCYL
ncbi:DUF523 and DUF1722 domain-containing protein [Ferrimonas gelatinilytica]|uniref:DUF523 and DUF1722 domain-containing protein n=1 Tax=Ferrimonas gelatinilytica TaxID=1255257 RepID=A0ABP9S1C6_9GAMM